ncbi:MAG TPA: GntR family transcriptional regulator [Casimicrobiaceae bacterium]|nr:GntR family transcriptional regulator [Casimicrobiaceae bacterium]
MSDTNAGAPLRAPLYQDIERRLTDALTRGEWKPGTAIPAERRLAARFGISLGTLRRAVDELVDANILIRQQGRGTFVARHTRDREVFHFLRVVPQRGPQAYPDVRLVSFTHGRARRDVAAALAVAPGAPVFRIRNVLWLGAAPVIVDDIALSAARFAGLSERAFRERSSTIYRFYEEAFGISVVRTRERLRATRADAVAARLLDVPRGSPLLTVRRIAQSYRDVPVEYRVSRVHTGRHEYWADIGG